MNSKIWLVISREYTTRVKKKGFIITTLLFPLFIVAMMALPALLQNITSSRPEAITICDPTGQIAPVLMEEGNLDYAITTDPVDSVIADPERMPVISFPADALSSRRLIVSYFSDESLSLEAQMAVTEDIKSAVEKLHLLAYDIDDLDTILKEIDTDVAVSTMVVNDKGDVESSDTLTGFIIGMAMSFVLYMFLLIYGQAVMMSIIEEKNNRVLELIVSSIKPTQLMLGKILGIGAVAVTQVAIWGLIVCGFVKFGLPAVLGADTMAQVQGVLAGTVDPSAAGVNMKLVQMMAIVGSFSYIFSIFGYLILFLIGGFLFYASIYAAIGASVDNAQDGSQLQIFATVPIIIALILSMSIGQDPNSSMAVWLSMIPFTSPMIMIMRIPSGVPFIETAASIAILALSVALTIWFAAKVYRVGIFMYGKKPTVKDLIRWARYK